MTSQTRRRSVDAGDRQQAPRAPADDVPTRTDGGRPGCLALRAAGGHRGPVKPPICQVCHVRFRPDEGGLVEFAMRPSDRAWQARRVKGHPPWKAWYCRDHLEAARARSHLTIDAATSQLDDAR